MVFNGGTIVRTKLKKTILLVIIIIMGLATFASAISSIYAKNFLPDKSIESVSFEEIGQLPFDPTIFEVDPSPFLDPYLPEVPLKVLPLPEQDYFLFEHHGGWWYDAEKTIDNNDDDLLCWAATATNVLEYTGWGVVNNFITTDDMFKHFQDHWIDKTGSPWYAWEWWFNSSTHTPLPDPTSTNRTDVPGGGNYWLSENFRDYVHWEDNSSRTMNAIDNYLHEGYPGVLAIIPPSGNGGHVITCWGLRKNIFGGYVGVWVTDSDDNKGTPAIPPPGPRNTLRYYDLGYNSSSKCWELTNYGSGWYIVETLALEKMPEMLGWHRPVANGGGPYFAFEGTPVHFIGSAIDIDGQDLQYRWDFNSDGFWDTTFSDTPTTSHTYEGEYSGNALLEVFDGIYKDVDEVEVTVTQIPSAFATLVQKENPNFLLPANPVNFTDLFYYLPFPYPYAFEWDFGDGTSQRGNLAGDITTIHTFSAPGDYTITLSIELETMVETYSSIIHVATMDEAIQDLNVYIQDLDNGCFKSNSDTRKNAINNIFSALNSKLSQEKYYGVINSLNQNIRQKTDGLIDGKIGNDWITDQEIQIQICTMIDNISDYLRTFL